MIRSMTGFGSSSSTVDGVHSYLEVRSVNNKYFKALIRLPEELQGLEAELETHAAKRLFRGSVVVTVKISDESAKAEATINTGVLEGYLRQLRAVNGLKDAGPLDVGALLALPGVVVQDTGEDRIEKARNELAKLLNEACDKVLAMRAREGRTVLAELRKHCGVIAGHLVVVKERVPRVVKLYQDRLMQRMQALLADSGKAVREEDLMREVAVYAERSDIAEEVSRLEGHMEQLGEILAAQNNEPSGRTMEFLSQELLREANTIASKCMDVEISRRIVEIKGAIDRIKEQVQNVE